MGAGMLILTLVFLLLAWTVPEARTGLLIAVGTFSFISLAFGFAGMLFLMRAADADRINTMGLPGIGQVLGLAQTGLMVNFSPQVKIDLLVRISGRAPYRATATEVVPLILLSRLEGDLPVRVDPLRPQSVAVQWDQVSPLPAAPISGSGTA
jgi:hypothetical protein